MKTQTKVIIFSSIMTFLVCMFLIPTVFAQPPFQTSMESEYTLQIEVPVLNEQIRSNTAWDFYIHAYRSNDSEIILNSDLTCTMHMYSYNNGGGHLVDDLMKPSSSHPFDIEYEINNTFFTESDQLSILYYCNSSQGLKGYFEYNPVVIDDDKNLNIDMNGISIIIFLIIVFALVIIFIYFNEFQWAGLTIALTGIILFASGFNVLISLFVLVAGILTATVIKK